ncbi:hypothetical protein JVT61DRAFT_10051 [Boletus reticuloceps]|uniref:Uncharacterized protein n=1 Tax=Boletus reticuloceps TaxID=495285 RepID=A0A8I2YZP4_9AGAM|nr:hypothetical protein JVT61DRAFT_10051 [Boletus reticuloceps]
MNVLTAVEALNDRLCKLFPCHWSNRGETLERPLSKTIRSVVKVLEDLLINAMEGTDVSDLEHRGLLLYQVAPDIAL